MNIKTVLIAFSLSCLMSTVAFPCGAPVIITGQVTVGQLPAVGSDVAIFADAEPLPIEVVRVSPFGYYAFSPVLPCNGYRVVASHSKLSITFAPVLIALSDLPQDGSNLIVNINGNW